MRLWLGHSAPVNGIKGQAIERSSDEAAAARKALSLSLRLSLPMDAILQRPSKPGDPVTFELFDDAPEPDGNPAPPVVLAPGALLLPGSARDAAAALVAAISTVTAQAPWRHLTVPGGAVMSVAMSNCGALGWVSDRSGYRYAAQDPLSGQPWPAMPEIFKSLAALAALGAGFAGFEPNACLINRYLPGARMGLHQDKDERDFTQPIVSLSLGLPAVFLWGGLQRTDKPARWRLAHGDAVVWGGPARLTFHGVAPLAAGDHPLLGGQRLNLTFRRVAVPL